MNIDEHTLGNLRELVPKARYESGGLSITGTDYRNTWNSPIPALSRGWLLTKVTPPEGFDRLVDTLRSLLEPFVPSTPVPGRDAARPAGLDWGRLRPPGCGSQPIAMR